MKLWVDAMRKVDEMKLHFQRYQQIIQVHADDNCQCSIAAYTELLISQIKALWNDFLLIEDIVNKLIEDADEQNSELLNVVQLFFACYEEIETVICNQNDPSELIQITDTVSIIMFILLPFVSGYSS